MASSYLPWPEKSTPFWSQSIAVVCPSAGALSIAKVINTRTNFALIGPSSAFDHMTYLEK
jgi:hypothetical protein